MPKDPIKKKKELVEPASSSDDDEEYDEESEGSNQFQSGDDEGDMREINKAHVLNYESDDSSDDNNMSDGSDDFNAHLSKQKESLQAGNIWGSKKQNFYGRDRKRADGESSEGEGEGESEDEYQEALRLQKVRAEKLSRQQQQQQQLEKEDQSEDDIQDLKESDESSDEDFTKKKGKKLGDKLFADDTINETNAQSLINMAKSLDPKTLKSLIQKDSPELPGLLDEFHSSLKYLQTTLSPLLQTPMLKTNKKYKKMFNYLQMKQSLVLSYCTYIAFYLLLKIEGKGVREHPVLFKITNIKSLIDSLEMVDEKVAPALMKISSKSKKTKKEKKSKSRKHKKSEEEEVDDENDEEELGEASYDDEIDSQQDDEDMLEASENEDEEIADEDIPLTKEEQRALRKQAKKQLKSKIATLDDDTDNIKDILKKSKKPKKSKAEQENEDPKQSKYNDNKLNNEKEEPILKKRINFSELKHNNLKQSGVNEVYDEQHQKMREKKAAKKEHQKELKEDAIKGVDKMRNNIQRNINYTIMKSKGLTRKRKKIDRNSRVKHREKYRKALIKRGSRVQEYKEGPKGKYGGEGSGVKASIIKSTKLT